MIQVGQTQARKQMAGVKPCQESIETRVMPRHAQIFFIGSVSINCTSDMLQVDSPPLLPKEMEDINDFYDSPEDHKVGILEKLLEELYDARCGD